MGAGAHLSWAMLRKLASRKCGRSHEWSIREKRPMEAVCGGGGGQSRGLLRFAAHGALSEGQTCVLLRTRHSGCPQTSRHFRAAFSPTVPCCWSPLCCTEHAGRWNLAPRPAPTTRLANDVATVIWPCAVPGAGGGQAGCAPATNSHGALSQLRGPNAKALLVRGCTPAPDRPLPAKSFW
jgi:hypothetical protein